MLAGKDARDGEADEEAQVAAPTHSRQKNSGHGLKGFISFSGDSLDLRRRRLVCNAPGDGGMVGWVYGGLGVAVFQVVPWRAIGRWIKHRLSSSSLKPAVRLVTADPARKGSQTPDG